LIVFNIHFKGYVAFRFNQRGELFILPFERVMYPKFSEDFLNDREFIFIGKPVLAIIHTARLSGKETLVKDYSAKTSVCY